MAYTEYEEKIGICGCGVSVSYRYKRKDILCKPCLNRRARLANKEKYKESYRKCYEINGQKYIKKSMEYKKLRLATDIQFRLRKNLRSRISTVLKGKSKLGSAVRDLGCSMEFLKEYLESKFQLGMTWNNYGKWHIDHIKPLINFDLTIKEQLLLACHYTNLQPLWANDNWSKGGR